jgi:uncharacterized protein involved in response to NO
VTGAVRSRFTPFAYGFRPFFLAAGIYAVLAVGAWACILRAGGASIGPVPPQLWHGHEMLFGFIGAAIAGFLLTAVPSWTGSRGFAGAPLVALTLLWFGGRAAFAGAAWLPWPAVAVVELSFLPLLAFLIGRSLIRERNRNLPMLFIVATLWGVDAWFLQALAAGDYALASRALRVGIGVVLLLVTVIGGRIVPSFTANALRGRGIAAEIRSRPLVEVLAIGAMALAVPVDAVWPAHPAAGALAAVAALAQAMRLAGWRSLRTLDEPIVWVLHAAYAWLPLGLALKALFLLGIADWARHWQHALTIGAAATMILAVMTRASLGHTGRPLVVSRAIAVAYGLLLSAAVVRIFAPALWPVRYLATLEAAALLWIAAFAIFVVVYTPILMRERADGKPG